MPALFSQLRFGAPWVLAGLLALPVLWWLLKVTPPQPRRIFFPPLQQRELPPKSPIARGAELVWLGDFLDPGALDAMRTLSYAGVIGHLVRIVDPAEEDFPYSGRARFESVRGRDALMFGRAENIGDAYRARFRAHGEEIAATALKLGWTITSHRTDHAPLSALIALHAAIGTA